MRHMILAYHRSKTLQTTNLDSWCEFVITSGRKGVCRVVTSAYTAAHVSAIKMILSCLCLMVVVCMFPRCLRGSAGLSMADALNRGSACDNASIKELELLGNNLRALSTHLITTLSELLHLIN